jgi:rhodanese-related sulfurtransferase
MLRQSGIKSKSKQKSVKTNTAKSISVTKNRNGLKKSIQSLNHPLSPHGEHNTADFSTINNGLVSSRKSKSSKLNSLFSVNVEIGNTLPTDSTDRHIAQKRSNNSKSGDTQYIINNQSSSIHTLKLLSPDAQNKFLELSAHLPPSTHPEYSTRRNWISHLLTHKLTVLPDFVAQLGRSVHIIDVRSEEEILSPVGYIRGANWFPKENIDKITTSFPKDGLIAVVCSNDTDSREVVRALKQTNHNLAAIVAGGMRSWKLMGFSSSRNPSILERKNIPVSVQYHQQQTQKSLESNKVGQKQMTLEQVIGHLGTGDNIQWIKMAAFMVHGRLSCIDGRDDSGVIGTPGGDMGEFITHLATAEQLLGSDLSEAQVNTLFQRRLDAFGRFYMHSDKVAAEKLVNMLSDRIDPGIRDVVKQLPPDFAIHDILSKIPREKMYQTLDILTMPEHIGCGHLQAMLTASDKYRVRHELVKTALKCFFRTRWEAVGGTAECDYVVLHGSHQECGVANISINREIQSYTKIPLISPSIQNKQIFVNHGQISQYLRYQHSQWFLEQTDILSFNKTSAAAYPALVDLLAEHHASQTVSILAKNLPMYTLEFSDDHSSCVVHYNGIIGSDSQEQAEVKQHDDQNKINTGHDGHSCGGGGHTHQLNKE